MASRSLSDLHPHTRAKAEAFLDLCATAGLDVLIYCTFRSRAEQAALYAQGRTAPGKIVTNARPGESRHNDVDVAGKPAARAFDGVPMRNGKPMWAKGDPLWKTYGALGKKAGLEWAGEWDSFPEYPHLQEPGA